MVNAPTGLGLASSLSSRMDEIENLRVDALLIAELGPVFVEDVIIEADDDGMIVDALFVEVVRAWLVIVAPDTLVILVLTPTAAVMILSVVDTKIAVSAASMTLTAGHEQCVDDVEEVDDVR